LRKASARGFATSFGLHACLGSYNVQAVGLMLAAVSSSSTPRSTVSIMHALSEQASSEQASSEQASSEQGRTALAWSRCVQRTLCELPLGDVSMLKANTEQLYSEKTPVQKRSFQ